MDPNMIWASNSYLVVFQVEILHNILQFLKLLLQGRAVDMKTLTLIEEPSEENLAEAEDEFERLLNESS